MSYIEYFAILSSHKIKLERWGGHSMSVQKGLKLKPKMHHTETTKQRKKEIE